MGLDYYVYVGPLVCCKIELQPTRQIFNGCTNTKCKNHQTRANFYGNFCPECGWRKGNFDYLAMKASILDYEFAQSELKNNMVSLGNYEIKQSFTSNGNMITRKTENENQDELHMYLPNTNNTPRKFKIYPREEDPTICEITEEIIICEKQWLRENYKNEITKIVNAYDAKNVKVIWAFVNGFN